MPYNPNGNPHYENYRPGKYRYENSASTRRGIIASDRRFDRQADIKRRNAPTCVVKWINETFDANITDLLSGKMANVFSCPIARTIKSVTGFRGTKVTGNLIYVNDVSINNYPKCIDDFIDNFDNGWYPQYYDNNLDS